LISIVSPCDANSDSLLTNAKSILQQG
jgi:hypothetical protein